MYIDGDTHYWPPRMLERVSHPEKGHVEITGDTASYYREGKPIWLSVREGRWNLDKRYEVMEQEGFDLQVLIPDNRPLIYELDPDLGRALARTYNDTVAEDLVGHDRFISVAWVYLPDIGEAVRELRRAVEDLGFHSVKVMGGFGKVELDDELLYPFYEEAARLDIPILLHPTAAINSARIFGEQSTDRLTGGLGLPFIYMATITRLILGGVLDQFPTLRFAFFEAGVGWVPFLMNRLDHQVRRGYGDDPAPGWFEGKGPEELPRPASAYFEQLYVAATSWETYLPSIVESWPNHNVICGSDYNHGDTVATWPNTVKGIKAIPGLSEQQAEEILGGNAVRLFGFDKHPERTPRHGQTLLTRPAVLSPAASSAPGQGSFRSRDDSH